MNPPSIPTPIQGCARSLEPQFPHRFKDDIEDEFLDSHTAILAYKHYDYRAGNEGSGDRP